MSQALLQISAKAANWMWDNNIYQSCLIITDSSACVQTLYLHEDQHWDETKHWDTAPVNNPGHNFLSSNTQNIYIPTYMYILLANSAQTAVLYFFFLDR